MSEAFDIRAAIGKEGGMSRSPSLAEDAARALREMILLEKLPAGTALTERDLADALGVSRTPMREAIRILANEGLVAYTAARRPFVADPSLDEINDCLRVQGTLEALAGELAATLATEAELREIERINASIKEARDAEEMLAAFRLDMAFHRQIVLAARNPPLAETHAIYNARLWRIRFLSSQRKEGRETTRQEHLDIVKNLVARDPGGTAAALRAHLRTAERNIKAALATREKERNSPS